jgi:xylulokinase
MFDQKERKWSRRMLEIFQIDSSILPAVVESHEVTGTLTKSAAAKLGLAEGTPVVGGGGDQQAGAVGNGVVVDGLVSAAMGTSGVVLVHSSRYKTDPGGRINTYCSAVAGEYCMFGCVLSAGGSIQWFRNVLGQQEIAEAQRRSTDAYKLLDAEAQVAPAGCDGLFWLPYLTGERTPYADPLARAGWIGIQAGTTRGHLVRAVLEGATFAMNDSVRLLADSGLKVKEIRLSGGGARSAFWRQLQADVYGATCVTINSDEGPAYGAALLAAVGTGLFDDVRQACRAAIKITRVVKPNSKSKGLYARYYAQYRRLYPALKGEFARIGELAGA